MSRHVINFLSMLFIGLILIIFENQASAFVTNIDIKKLRKGGLAMFCRKCGNNIPDDSEFCPKCGIKVINLQNKKVINNAKISITNTVNDIKSSTNFSISNINFRKIYYSRIGRLIICLALSFIIPAIVVLLLSQSIKSATEFIFNSNGLPAYMASSMGSCLVYILMMLPLIYGLKRIGITKRTYEIEILTVMVIVSGIVRCYTGSMMPFPLEYAFMVYICGPVLIIGCITLLFSFFYKRKKDKFTINNDIDNITVNDIEKEKNVNTSFSPKLKRILLLVAVVILATLGVLWYFSSDYYFSESDLKEVKINGISSSFILRSPVELEKLETNKDKENYTYKMFIADNFTCEITSRVIEEVSSPYGGVWMRYTDDSALSDVRIKMMESTIRKNEFKEGPHDTMSNDNIHGKKMVCSYKEENGDKFESDVLAFHDKNEFWTIKFTFRESNIKAKKIIKTIEENIKMSDN